MPTKKATITPAIPINLANCFQGTRPITIIKKTTPKSSAAVDVYKRQVYQIFIVAEQTEGYFEFQGIGEVRMINGKLDRVLHMFASH